MCDRLLRCQIWHGWKKYLLHYQYENINNSICASCLESKIIFNQLSDHCILAEGSLIRVSEAWWRCLAENMKLFSFEICFFASTSRPTQAMKNDIKMSKQMLKE